MGIPTQEARNMQDLIDRDLIRLLTDEKIIQFIKSKRNFGGVGISVAFGPDKSSARGVVAIDSNEFASRGPISLAGRVRDLLDRFRVVTKIVEDKNLNWVHLQDSEVHLFLREALSEGGRGYRVFDLSDPSR